MIGIFDSGVGGLASYKEVRRLLPRENIVYLADRKNAPYGTKTKDELVSLVKNDIKRLRDLGADKILIACCTASTVHGNLEPEDQVISVPIISTTAREAALYRSIAVIATEHTVKIGAFGHEIRRINPDAAVSEIEAQELVSLVEGGERDGRLTVYADRIIDSIAKKIRACSPDALILGCTHFSHLERELADRLPGVKILTPARIGAIGFAQNYQKENMTHAERGITVYT